MFILFKFHNPSNLIYQSCLLKCYNHSYWIYQKVSTDWKSTYWIKKCRLTENVPIERKGVYQKMSTKRYTKKCPLAEKSVYWMKRYILAEKMPIVWKSVYWLKMCLLIENMLIEWKRVYWLKICLLNENVLVDRKAVYWKIKSHNCLVFF